MFKEFDKALDELVSFIKNEKERLERMDATSQLRKRHLKGERK